MTQQSLPITMHISKAIQNSSEIADIKWEFFAKPSMWSNTVVKN